MTNHTKRYRKRKWTYIIGGIVLGVVLAYPVVGNVLLYSGALESIISRKPEKLKIQWDSAWTLLPGQINVDGLKLDIHTRKNRIQINADEAQIELSLLPLIERSVEIDFGDINGLSFSYTPREQPANPAAAEVKTGVANDEATARPPAPVAQTQTAEKKPKPPWTIQINNTSAKNVKSIRFKQLKISGRGELRQFAMRLVTKGGPLRIDKLNLDMKVAADPGSDPDTANANLAHLTANIRLAENIPKQNKGKKLLKFLSGQLAVTGEARTIEFINPLFGDKVKFNVSGGGELDVLAIVEAGELLNGSRLDFDPGHFEADFPTFQLSGTGKMAAGIQRQGKDPVAMALDIADLDLDVHTRKSRIQTAINRALIELRLLPLLEQTVDITRGEIDGLSLAFTPTEKPAQAAVVGKDAKARDDKTAVLAPAAVTLTQTAEKKPKPPWTIQIDNTSAKNVKSIRFKQLKISGRGELRQFAMRLVTKGGPLRIDKLNLDMKVAADPNADPDTAGAEYAHVKADMKLAENFPKQNKGKKLLKFLSGQLAVTGEASTIEFINPLLGDKYKLNVSGGGELDILAILDSGELLDGSRIKFNSAGLETDFLDLHTAGAGSIVGSIDKRQKEVVAITISVTDFRLNRQGVPNPYMEGADLFINLYGSRLYLDREMEDDRLLVDFPHSILPDLTDYNRFIPKQANVKILSGSGSLKGTMSLSGKSGRINLDLTGKDVSLDVNGREIHTDLKLVTKLSDGRYGEKSYDLTGTFFRLDETPSAAGQARAESGWWGEVEISKGDLIWTEPMDIDAEMKIKMRDTEPLIALLSDAKKKRSLLDKALTIRDLSGTLGIATNEKDIILDPILIKGRGLEVVSKLDVLEKSINGVLYLKLHGIATNFEIKDNKAKFKGFGGKKKVEKNVNIGEPDREEIEMRVQRNPHPSKPMSKNFQ